MRYEPLQPISHLDAELAESGTPEQLAVATISIGLHDDESAWAVSFCTRLAFHLSPVVRRAAMIVLAHLARRFGELCEDRVRPLIEASLTDADAGVRGQADDAADDIAVFLKWRVTRPV